MWEENDCQHNCTESFKLDCFECAETETEKQCAKEKKQKEVKRNKALSAVCVSLLLDQ